MSNELELSETRRALLEKYLRKDRLQIAMAAGISPHIKAEAAERREHAVAVQTGGAKRPFFFLHGHWKGNAFYCFPLARALGSDQSFYALEPYRFDGLQVPPPLETIAAAHLESLRAIQPEGPYLLGGFCNGALVAYEMARQLHAAEQTIDLLLLMDPMAFSSTYPIHYRALRAIISRFGRLMRLGPDKQLDWYVLLRHVVRQGYSYLRDLPRLKDSKRLGAGEQIEPELRRDLFALPQRDALVLTQESFYQDFPSIFEWVALGYTPPSVYPGKVTFFWPSEELWHSRWWSKVAEATEVEVHVIPGTQVTWKTEYLHPLAECLRTCLSRCQ
ncbi:MAG: hypothetical protein JO125_02690 [Chloroflexi bacterium]|nr:hypothetical protein [Chloroflexota bacterium]